MTIPHLIEAKYLGPTERTGPRVKLVSHLFNESVTISYDYDIGNIVYQASEWLRNRGFEIVNRWEMGESFGILSSTLKRLKNLDA